MSDIMDALRKAASMSGWRCTSSGTWLLVNSVGRIVGSASRAANGYYAEASGRMLGEYIDLDAAKAATERAAATQPAASEGKDDPHRPR